MTRVVVFSLLGSLLMVLLGPVQDLLGMDMVVLDVPLIIVVYLAMSDRVAAYGRLISRSGISTSSIDWSGGLTALALGYVTDVLGAGTKGIHCLSLAVVFLVCRRASRQVYLASTLSAVLVTLTASLGATALGAFVLWVVGRPPDLDLLWVAAVQALLCAAAAPPLIRLLRFIDGRLLRESQWGRLRG